ncbi:hypothetical protein Tco_0099591 [Tanacetum coccineum]
METILYGTNARVHRHKVLQHILDHKGVNMMATPLRSILLKPCYDYWLWDLPKRIFEAQIESSESRNLVNEDVGEALVKGENVGYHRLLAEVGEEAQLTGVSKGWECCLKLKLSPRVYQSFIHTVHGLIKENVTLDEPFIIARYKEIHVDDKLRYLLVKGFGWKLWRGPEFIGCED